VWPAPGPRHRAPRPLPPPGSRRSTLVGLGTFDPWTPRPCVVIDGADRRSGQVLARYREADSWRAVVRYTRWTSEGWPMTHELALPASCLLPRATLTPHAATPAPESGRAACAGVLRAGTSSAAAALHDSSLRHLNAVGRPRRAPWGDSRSGPPLFAGTTSGAATRCGRRPPRTTGRGPPGVASTPPVSPTDARILRPGTRGRWGRSEANGLLARGRIVVRRPHDSPHALPRAAGSA
jgi:hypothetical protein